MIKIVNKKNDKIIPTVAVLIIKDDKVLLVRHTKKAGHLTGTYGLPSGRIDENETERRAAVRELLEETGLQTEEDSLIEFPKNFYIADLERKGGKKLKFGWRVFLCRDYKGKIEESEETIPQWVKIEKLDQYNLLPNIKDAVVAAQRSLAK